MSAESRPNILPNMSRQSEVVPGHTGNLLIRLQLFSDRPTICDAARFVPSSASGISPSAPDDPCGLRALMQAASRPRGGGAAGGEESGAATL
jgi:hypothetical protein